MAALEAKNRFGELLDAAQREPVTIEKHGRRVAVMVSAQDYQDLETLKLMSLSPTVSQEFLVLRAGAASSTTRTSLLCLRQQDGEASSHRGN